MRHCVLTILLLALSSTACLAADGQKYLDACRRFADTVLEKGRDTYGKKKTPLFVDGLNTTTFEPLIWHWKGNHWVLSNFANHQSLLRLLDGLTTLTGDKQYRKAAEAATAYALTHLRTPNGLMNWGGHRAWDLEKDEACYYQKQHELRNQAPYFAFLWRVNPDETGRLMEATWGAHIYDWKTLDFNRHSSSPTEPRPAQWDAKFQEEIKVPFPSTTKENLSFANAAGPLIHVGASLARLGHRPKAELWTRRFAMRWQQGLHPKTKLGGGQISIRPVDRAHQAYGHVHPHINEANMIASYHLNSRYESMPLIQMYAGEMLGGTTGGKLVRWASDDLKAFAKHAYDEKTNAFRPLINDGTPLKFEESKLNYYPPKRMGPHKAGSDTLWIYAAAYRLTKDPAHWAMLARLCKALKFGDLGAADGKGRKMNMTTGWSGHWLVYAHLELHRATNDKTFLKLAARVGDNTIAKRDKNGFPKDLKYVRTGDEDVLALMHIAAALGGRSTRIPAPRYDQQYFHCAYDGVKPRTFAKYTDYRTFDFKFYKEKK